MDKIKYPCPVCGEMFLDEPMWSFDLCPVCGWQEDGHQQLHPDDTGPNGKWTLNDARKAWANGETLFKRHPNPNSK